MNWNKKLVVAVAAMASGLTAWTVSGIAVATSGLTWRVS